MAHFAKVKNGKVLRVIVASQDFVDSYVDGVPGRWIQTSYNTRHGKHALGGTPLRYNFANPGGNYDPDGDAFYAEQPFPSWTLNKSTYEWEPPTALPADGKAYRWIEDSKSWVEI